MPRRARHSGRDGGFAVGNDSIADRVDVEPQPLAGAAALGIVGRSVMVYAAYLAQAIVLGEFVRAIWIVDGVGLATAFLHD